MATSGNIPNRLEQSFPKLQQSQYSITSPESSEYNCIAWVVGFDDVWMWPDPPKQDYWPEEVVREPTLPAFIEAFTVFGFEVCDSEELEPDVEKVALFALHGSPKHAVRQLPNGLWSSKCGNLEDISPDLRALESESYGEVAVILSRTRLRV